MGQSLSTKMVAKKLGLPQKEVLKRIRTGEIPATKFDWIWVVDEDDLPTVKASDWYKRYQSNA